MMHYTMSECMRVYIECDYSNSQKYGEDMYADGNSIFPRLMFPTSSSYWHFRTSTEEYFW